MEINMLPNQRRLMRSQLEQTLSRFSALQGLQPPRGWIRAIREALGMSGAQLAARLGVTPPRVTVLERDEVAGAVSLKTLRQAAEALDCVLVYALVPRSSFEQTLRTQAGLVARERMARSSHSMLLENQRLSPEEEERMRDELIEELVRTSPKNLWSKDL
jgi:predicted DNA-binding mobile mystery protein A